MPVCPKCHRFKPKRLINRHLAICVPTPEQIAHASVSKSGLGDKARKDKPKP